MFEGRTRLFSPAIAIGAALMAGVALAGAAADGGLDPSVRAGDDFYGHVNNTWLKAARIPDGASSVDTTAMLRVLNAGRVRGLVEDAVKASMRGGAIPAETRKIADYYSARLNGAGIEGGGLAPISRDLATIAAIGDRHALAAYLGQTLRLDDGTNQQTESLWGVWVHQGFHDPDHYAVHIVQGGLGLSDPDDYLDAAPEHAAHRALYQAHVAAMLRIAGLDRPGERAARVVDLEAAIARTHASRADTDDVFKTDNEWRSGDFAGKAPGVDWAAYFAAAGIGPATRFVVWQPQAVIGGARLVAD
jgi:predicted metalloendopeptidase